MTRAIAGCDTSSSSGRALIFCKARRLGRAVLVNALFIAELHQRHMLQSQNASSVGICASTVSQVLASRAGATCSQPSRCSVRNTRPQVRSCALTPTAWGASCTPATASRAAARTVCQARAGICRSWPLTAIQANEEAPQAERLPGEVVADCAGLGLGMKLLLAGNGAAFRLCEFAQASQAFGVLHKVTRA